MSDDRDGHLKLVSYRNVAPGIKVEIHRRIVAECLDLNQLVREWPVDIVGANTINNKNNNEKKQGIRPSISLRAQRIRALHSSKFPLNCAIFKLIVKPSFR